MLGGVQLAQFEAGFPKKFGVFGEQFDAPVNLVHDALSWPMSAVKKLKVLQSVISFLTVDVMDCFLGAKPTSKVLFHDVAVLKDFTRWFAVATLHNQPNVTVTRWARLISSSFAQPPLFGFLEFRTADRAANLAQSVHRSTGPALDRHAFAALDTVCLPVFVFQHLAVKATAAAAVFRVFAPVLAVRAQLADRERERLLALKTFEFNTLRFRVGAADPRQVGVVAGLTAKTVSFSLVQGLKGVSALFTGFWVKHDSPLFVRSLYRTLSVPATRISGAV